MHACMAHTCMCAHPCASNVRTHAGATNTLSTTVIVLEVTNQQDLLVPILLGVVASCGVTNLLSYSVFDQARFVNERGSPPSHG